MHDISCSDLTLQRRDASRFISMQSMWILQLDWPTIRAYLTALYWYDMVDTRGVSHMTIVVDKCTTINSTAHSSCILYLGRRFL